MDLRSLPVLAVLALSACGTVETDPGAAEAPASDPFAPDSFADSVALAHGYDRWGDVARVAFDFVVAADDTHRVERAWTWYPRTDSVVRAVGGETTAYLRSAALDSVEREADAQFINDSYWLMMPFYLVWSEEGYTPTVTRGVRAPISGEEATMLTIAYDDRGGYTPGDAYDLYVGADYRLLEWVYRRGGGEEAGAITRWAGYRELEGLLLPTTHPSEGPVAITHPNVSVELVGG